jgi:hypothetical protein
MRLVVSGFNVGLVDEDAITRMGIAVVQHQKDLQGHITDSAIPNCPASDIDGMDFYTRQALNKMKGREAMNTTPWVAAPITRIYQWQDPSTAEHTLVLSCV